MDLPWQWPGTLGLQSQCPTCTNVRRVLVHPEPREPERSRKERRASALSVGPVVAMTLAGELDTARQNVSPVWQFFGLKRWEWCSVTLAFILLWISERGLLNNDSILYSIHFNCFHLFPINSLICFAFCVWNILDHPLCQAHVGVGSSAAHVLLWLLQPGRTAERKMKWRKKYRKQITSEIVRKMISLWYWNCQEGLLSKSICILCILYPTWSRWNLATLEILPDTVLFLDDFAFRTVNPGTGEWVVPEDG